MNDQTVILSSLVGATSVAYVGALSRKEEVTLRPVLGMFVAGTFLLMIAMWSTSLATAFAVIILATAFVVNGADFFKGLGALQK